MKTEANQIIQNAIKACLPDEAVRRALQHKQFSSGRLVLVSIGKAAWQMASCAADTLRERIDEGIVITKYGHSKGDIPQCRIYEAGHPIPDENSFHATKEVMDMVSGLKEEDTVLFLVSGGGSALFEYPLVPPEELTGLTEALLKSGADIVEMNTIRKRISAVKGGKFAKLCAPAHVYTVILSDIIGDPIDMIASGPACPDTSTCKQAKSILKKYQIRPSEMFSCLMDIETPKKLNNVETIITGSVKQLCIAAAETCKQLGYETVLLTDQLSCQAKEAGSFLGTIAQTHARSEKSLAFLAGGETVVHVLGEGKGGRNQELALAAAEKIDGLENVVIFSVGSDGTDGPTDAAGGIVDGNTAGELRKQKIDIQTVLLENDAYSALQAVDGLIITGPTGTNVNDVACVLIKSS